MAFPRRRKMHRHFWSVVSFMLACLGWASAQQSWFSGALVQRRDVQQAFAYIDQHRDEQLQEWIRITEIPAPSGQEGKRAAYIESEMKKAGLDDVYRDKAGNVVGRLKGI